MSRPINGHELFYLYQRALFKGGALYDMLLNFVHIHLWYDLRNFTIPLLESQNKYFAILMLLDLQALSEASLI